MLEMCLQEDWAFSSQTVGNISQAFALITFGSAFMHGSNTELGQKQDAVSNDLFPFIIYQAGVSNIAYDPVIHDLDLEPRPLSAEGIVAELFHMYESQPVSSWLSICNTISMPSLQRTFTGIFGYILTLLLDPDIVDQLVPVFLDLLAVSEEDREFTTLHFLPAIREASSEHYLGLRDRLVLWRDTLATVVKLFYAFIWQEKVIDFGGSNLTPEANQLGAQLLPIINQYANNQTSWSLHVEDVQAGEGYPGWQSCNPTIPHAKWHVQIAASLTDVSRLMDSVLRMVTAAATTTTTQTTTTITTKTTLETTTTAPTTETTITETCDPKLPTGSNCPASHDRGPLPDPDDCTAFWMCHDGCAVKTQCPVGTLYDMAEKACVPNNLIDCKASHRPCASEMHCSCVDRLPHPQQDERCSEDSSFDENFLVDENDCLSFFNCTLGCFDHYSCGTHNSVGLLWNQEHDWCDFPENVHCGTRPCNDPERCHGDNKPGPTTTTTTTRPSTTSTTSTSTTPDCGHTGFCEE